MMYEEYLDAVLSWTNDRRGEPFPICHRLRRCYLDGADDRTRANIRSSINTKLALYEPVAAVWQKAYELGRRFSLEAWTRPGCNQILVLGNDEASRAAIDPINRALFRRATELLLSRKELKQEQKQHGRDFSWVFLDEVREAGKLDGLGRLLTKGRSKGVCVVLGFQDIDGMRDVYGEEAANELTGQCHNIALLQMSNPTTAEWATALFGKYLARTISSSTDIRPDSGFGMGKSYAQDERSALYTRALITLPKTGPERGLTGFYRSPHRDPATEDPEVHLRWTTQVLPFLPPEGDPEDEDTGNFSREEVTEQYLRPWNRSDWARLGFDGEPPSLEPTQRVISEPVTPNQLREMLR